MVLFDELRRLFPNSEMVWIEPDWSKADQPTHDAARAFLKAWDEQLAKRGESIGQSLYRVVDATGSSK